MPEDVPTPLIGVPVTFSTDNPARMPHHHVGDKYLRSLVDGSRALPMMIPALGDALDFAEVVERIDGLLLTGGRANVEPHHYGGPPFPEDEIVDPARDATVLPLIRACIDKGIPVFGICRGIQEINVALGGSLHYRVHLLPGKMDHRMRRDVDTSEERMALRHPVSLAPGGLMEQLAGAGEVMVNSLHGQSIDRPADGLAVEALSRDGVIEGVHLKEAKRLTVGVQWHAEWQIEKHTLSRRLFEAFGEAARDCARAKRGRQRVG